MTITVYNIITGKMEEEATESEIVAQLELDEGYTYRTITHEELIKIIDVLCPDSDASNLYRIASMLNIPLEMLIDAIQLEQWRRGNNKLQYKICNENYSNEKQFIEV